MPPSHGVFGLVYGPAKSGKTLSTGLILFSGGVFFGERAALTPIQSYYNFALPTVYTPKNLDDLFTALQAAIKAGRKRFVIDDLTLMIQKESAANNGKPNWPKLVQTIVKIAALAKEIEDAGGILFVTLHERNAREYNGKTLRGGPDLPGSLTETFSGMVSVALRNKYDETSRPYPYTLISGPQKDFVSGDRWNVFPNPSPLNIVEGMVLAGFDIPYAPELGEWGPKAIETLYPRFIDNLENWRELFQELGPEFKSKDPKHVRFILVQSLHRAIFRTAGTLDAVLAGLTAD